MDLKEKRDDPLDDDIQECMGPIGRFQLLIYLLLFPCQVTTAFHPMAIVLLAPPVEYTCMDNYSNETFERLNACPCADPQYNTSVFENTIIMNWNLICENEWLANLSQTILMLGMLCGSVIFGSISDRFGRRSLIVPVLLELITGMGASFVTHYWMFLVLRFIIGASIGGTIGIAFVLFIEFMGKQYREMASCIFQIPFNVGYMLLPLIGYYVRNWNWMQFAFSTVDILMLIAFWFLPESPRWLLATGKTEKAIHVISKAARINNLPTEKIEEIIHNYQKNKPMQQREGTVIYLFKTKNIRKNMICMCIIWVVCSFGYYGLSQYVGQLDGDIFVNVAIVAALNLIGTFTAVICTKLLSRRSSLCSMNVLTSICMFIIAFIPKGGIATVVLACIGNVGMFISFIIVYLYTSELFPTIVRNAAIGTASMTARVGSMSAPFVVYLNSTATWLPPVIFGIAPILAALLSIMLPETKGCILPSTIEDGEAFDKKRIKGNTHHGDLKLRKVLE